MTYSAHIGSSLIYLAADLFTPFARERNKIIAQALREAGHDTFLPQEIVAPMTADGLDMKVVFEGCASGVLRADLVLAIADGSEIDAGVAWELGYAAAREIPTLVIRSDLRRSEYRGVNVMIEFGASRIVYANGYKLDATSLVEVIVSEVNATLPTKGVS